MNDARDYYRQLAFAFVALLVVGAFAARSGILAIDGRHSYWNLAAFCEQAYGNPTIRRCKDGSPRTDIPQ